jgi:hypothetical protein
VSGGRYQKAQVNRDYMCSFFFFFIYFEIGRAVTNRWPILGNNALLMSWSQQGTYTHTVKHGEVTSCLVQVAQRGPLSAQVCTSIGNTCVSIFRIV